MNDLIPSGVKRTPLECEVRWRGYLHPTFNHGSWKPEETTRLHGLVAEAKSKGTRLNWAQIAKDLGVRVHILPSEGMRLLISAQDRQNASRMYAPSDNTSCTRLVKACRSRSNGGCRCVWAEQLATRCASVFYSVIHLARC